MSVLSPLVTSLPHQPGPLCHCLTILFIYFSSLKLLQLEPTNDQHVQSAERGTERTRLCRSLLQIFLLLLLCHARRFNGSDPGPQPPSGVLRGKKLEAEDR